LWIPWERARSFSGRSWLFEIISDWLDSPTRTMAIVGSPGSGKSAIAVQAASSSAGQASAPYDSLPKGWLAATHFCDAYRSETLDPALFVRSVIRQFSVGIPGFADAVRSAAIDITGTPVHVTATVTAGTVYPAATVVGAEVELRGYTSGEIASRILGEALRSLDLAVRPVILVDGIDEAVAFPTDMTIADLLTGPTFQDLPVRLLITSRPAGFMYVPGTRIVDLDAEVTQGNADVQQYVRQRLMSAAPHNQLDVLSSSLALASGGNFLYAHHVVRTLLDRDREGAGPDTWAAPPLPVDLAEVYEGFRRRAIAITGSEERKRHWRTVLRPILSLLAVAQGDGLTRPQLQVISGLDGDAVNDALEDLSQFLQFGSTAAPIHVFHNSFREYLTTGLAPGLPTIDANAAHAKITTAALRQAGAQAGPSGSGWEHADGYTKRHLALHARRAGMLPDLLTDVGFLAFMEPYGLLSAIESLNELPTEALAYRQVFPELLGDDAGLRLAYLDIAFHIYALRGQIERLTELPVRRPWACRWSRARPSVHRRNMVGHEHEVTAVTAAQLTGKLLVVSGDAAGHIMVWDADSGALLRRCRGHDAAVVDLAVVWLAEGPAIISGAEDCTLRKWDLETLQPLGVFSAGLGPPSKGERITRVAEGDGKNLVIVGLDDAGKQAEGPVAHQIRMSAVRCVSVADLHLVVTAGEDATVRVWDAESMTVGLESGGYPQGIEALDATAFRDTVLIATASHLDVTVWEFPTRNGYLVSQDFRFNVRALAFTRIGEDLGLLTPGHDTGASLWNVRTGELARELPTPSQVALLAGTADPSPSCMIAALADGRIRVWSGEPDSWHDLYGHNSAITSVAAADVDGSLVILSGGADHSVRVWDPPRNAEVTQAEATTHVWTLHTTNLGARAVVVVSSIIGLVSVYDMASGEELHRFRGNPKEVYRSCLAAGDRGLALVAVGDDGLVRVWDARSGGLVHRFDGRRCLDSALDLAHLGGRVVAFLTTRSGVAGVDINSGAVLYEFDVPTSRFTTVAAVSTSTDTFMVVVLDRETLLVWSGNDRSLVPVEACTLPASKLAVTSYDGQMVIVLGYPDGHVETWNQTTGEHTVLAGHAVEMTSLSAAFVGPDLVVATSAGARDVRISVSAVLHEIRVTGDVRDLAVHSSGAVAVGATDGVTCIDLITPSRGTGAVGAARDLAGTAAVELQADSPADNDKELFDPKTTDFLVGLAEDYGHTGRASAPASTLMQADLNEAIERYSRRHPVVARKLTKIAGQLAAEGRITEALSAVTEALSIADEIAMPKIDLTEVLESTASLQRRGGNLDAALEVLQRLVSIYSEDSAHTALLGETLTQAAEVLIEAGRPDEARTTMSDALATLAEAYGADHEALCKSLGRAASACSNRGNVRGAIGYMQQALTFDERRAPSGDHQTREDLLALAWLAQRTDIPNMWATPPPGTDGTEDDHQALLHLDRALTVSRHLYGAHSQEVVDILGLLAHLLAGTGSRDQAIEFLLQSIAAESEGQLTDPGGAANRLSLLVKLLLESGLFEQGAEAAQWLVVAAESAHGPESIETAAAFNSHGVALLLIGDLEGARASLEHAAELLQQSQNAPEELRQAVSGALAEVLRQVGPETGSSPSRADSGTVHNPYSSARSSDTRAERAVSLPPETVQDAVQASGMANRTGDLDPVGEFIGRDAPLFELETAVQLQKVTVVLHGTGGSGKTELGKAFGRRWRATGENGRREWVFFHSFAPRGAMASLGSVVTEIGLRVYGANFSDLDALDRQAAVEKFLTENRALLIWDNFETVKSMPWISGPEAAPAAPSDETRFAAFLDRLEKAGSSTVLVISRSPEHWLGGRICRIQLSGLTRREASQYADHLLAPYPGAQPKRSDRAFADLMDLLGGNPLCMRLMIPRLEECTPGEIINVLRGIEPELGVSDPTQGPGGAFESLYGCISYSYEFLTPVARQLLPAISIFETVVEPVILAGISDFSDIPQRFKASREEWERVLAEAANVGLLELLDGSAFSIHPALPAFLSARWREEDGNGYHDARKAVNRALCYGFARMASWLANEIGSGNGGLAIEVVESRGGNLGGMLGFAISEKFWKEAQAIFALLNFYWENRNMIEEASTWTRRIYLAIIPGAVTANLASPEGFFWVNVARAEANRYRQMMQLDEAEAVLRRILSAFEGVEEGYWSTLEATGEGYWSPRVELAQVYLDLGSVAEWRGHTEEARGYYQKALAAGGESADSKLVSSVYARLGATALDEGLLDEAEKWCNKSLATAREVDVDSNAAGNYHVLGVVARERKQLDQARRWFRELLAAADRANHSAQRSLAYHSLGMVEQDRGAFEAAEDLYLRSLSISEKIGDRPAMARTYAQLGQLATVREQFDDAENWSLKALAIAEETGDPLVLPTLYMMLGAASVQKGNYSDSLEWCIKSLAITDGVPKPSNGPAAELLAAITNSIMGLPALEEAWRRITGLPLPEIVRDYVKAASRK
jgi:WD40 repeat protein/tetratricopeptide (TPR) repeat protein